MSRIHSKQIKYQGGSGIGSGISFEGGLGLIRNVAEPLLGTDAATKSYVDTYAIAGAHATAAVQVATVSALTFPSDFMPGDIIDGYTLQIGDRVLVKDQAIAAENGLYVITTGGPERAPDADGTPMGEVGQGDATFVVNGTVNGATTWVLITPDPITVGVTGLTYTQSAAGVSYTASTGITLDVADFKLDFTTLTPAGIAAADTIAFYDVSGTAMANTTIANFINNLDIVTSVGLSAGLLVKTADDSYASRTLTASANNNRLGLQVLNGTGAAGDPTIGLNIAGLTTLTVPEAATDYVPVYNGATATNKKVSLATILANTLTGITTDTGAMDLSGHAISILGSDGINVTHAATTITVELDLKANGGLVFETGKLAVDLSASNITGFVSVTNGGSGLTATSVGGILRGTSTTAYDVLAIGSSGYVLTSNGTTFSWQPANAGDITGVTAGNGVTGGGTSGDVTIDVGAGLGILSNANDVSINLGAGSTGNGLSKILGSGTNELGVYINGASDTTNLVSALAISSGSLKVGIDASTIVYDGLTGLISVGTIDSTYVSDFVTAAKDAVITATVFDNSGTVDFTVVSGTTVQANVGSNVITDVHLDTTNTGTVGQILQLATGEQFTWVDKPYVPVQGYVQQLAANATDKDNLNGGGNITTAVIVSDIFGANVPVSTVRPFAWINGLMTPIAEVNTGSLFFSNDTIAPFTAVAFGSLAGTENLIANTDGLGYDIATSDEIVVTYGY
jgi:hypothetical protein